MTEETRQLAVVIDLNKCMGCQTCTIACKNLWTNDVGMDHVWWMKVNTVPGRGYPKDWEKMGGGFDGEGNLTLGRRPGPEDYGTPMEFDYQEVFFGGQGGKSHLAPLTKPGWGPNWDEDIASGDYPNAYFYYLPRFCNHCSQPACAQACPHGAIEKRQPDGLVVIVDEGQCQTCSDLACMEGCPYKEIFWNPQRKMAQKCDGCLPRLEQGIAPACIRQCPGRCIWLGFLDEPESPVHKLVREWKVALPLHAEFGTGPNIYYVPPLSPTRIDGNGNPDPGEPRIPTAALAEMFGDGVEAALEQLREGMERKRQKLESELMDVLIVRRWHELLGAFTGDPGETGGA